MWRRVSSLIVVNFDTHTHTHTLSVYAVPGSQSTGNDEAATAATAAQSSSATVSEKNLCVIIGGSEASNDMVAVIDVASTDD